MPVADLGFHRRDEQRLSLKQKPIIWKDFCQILHENEKEIGWAHLPTTSPPSPDWICQ